MMKQSDTRIKVRQATNDDIRALAPVLRQADIREIRAATGLGPSAGLKASFDYSDQCYFATYDDQPLALFGIATDMQDQTLGVPWLLGADLLADCRISLLRLSKAYLAEWGETFARLANFVKADHHASQIYLRHLGFEFGAPIALGPMGDEFIPFFKITDNGE